MMIETKLPFDQQYVRTFSEGHGEPSWLLNLRLQALAKAEELPLPKPDKTKIDKWNFTQFTHHVVQSAPLSSLEELPEAVKALIDLEEETKNLYVQRDHTPAYLSLSDDLKQKGVIFTDIFTAVREHGELVAKYFMKDGVQVDEHRLTALHAALMNGGVFVYVPKNVEVKTPLQAVYIQEQEDTALFNHVIIVAEENSSVAYVENYISLQDQSCAVANIVAEVFALTNARVFFAAVDHMAKGIKT